MSRKPLDPPHEPWAVMSPNGLEYVGLEKDEAGAWRTALGWPDEEEITAHRAKGWYAAPVTLTWKPSA